MSYRVSELTTPAQPTAVIAESTTWPAFPTLWPVLLAEVWEAVRSDAEIVPNRNVMLYKDDVPNVEIGVEVAGPFAAFGRVVPGSLPEGRVATTTHRGRYEEVGAAHAAIVEWCDARGLERCRERWEVYGHHAENVEDQLVDVFYLLH